MCKTILLCLIAVVAAGCAHSGDFAARVEAGNTAASTVPGKNYERLLVPAIRDAIQFCIPPGSTSPANLGTFTFVSEVNSSGVVLNAEVQPKTPISQCFLERFSKTELPKPPDSSYSNGYPITIEMRIKP